MRLNYHPRKREICIENERQFRFVSGGLKRLLSLECLAEIIQLASVEDCIEKNTMKGVY